MTAVIIPDRVLAGIWDRIDVKGPDECWPWKLSLGSHGYGQAVWWENGKSTGTTAHRAAWTAANGPIPDNLTVDHICRNRLCCNPRHLRLLTNEANARDNGPARRTRCPHGHAYTPENTYVDPAGHRGCRTCIAARSQAKRDRLRTAKAVAIAGRTCEVCGVALPPTMRAHARRCGKKCGNAARFLKAVS